VNITVHVKPGSRKGPLVEDATADDVATLTVYMQQRAVDGQANAALVVILAKHFGVSNSSVEIIRGHTSRIKLVAVDLPS
jgi:uncharacterized protein YggU (UPF0235/DUF167 family)